MASCFCCAASTLEAPSCKSCATAGFVSSHQNVDRDRDSINLRIDRMSGEAPVVVRAATNLTILELKELIVQTSHFEYGTIVENLIRGDQILLDAISLQDARLADGDTLLAIYTQSISGVFNRMRAHFDGPDFDDYRELCWSGYAGSWSDYSNEYSAPYLAEVQRVTFFQEGQLTRPHEMRNMLLIVKKRFFDEYGSGRVERSRCCHTTSYKFNYTISRIQHQTDKMQVCLELCGGQRGCCECGYTCERQCENPCWHPLTDTACVYSGVVSGSTKFPTDRRLSIPDLGIYVFDVEAKWRINSSSGIVDPSSPNFYSRWLEAYGGRREREEEEEEWLAWTGPLVHERSELQHLISATRYADNEEAWPSQMEPHRHSTEKGKGLRDHASRERWREQSKKENRKPMSVSEQRLQQNMLRKRHTKIRRLERAWCHFAALV